MYTDEKLQSIIDRLKEVDEKSSQGLVNFVNHTIDWTEIATVALEAAMEITEGEK